MEEQAEGNAPKRQRNAAEDLSSEGSLEEKVAALRAALLASLEDSRRCAISAAELVHLEWRFSFVTDHRRLFEGGVGEPQPPGETASFRPDSTFVSSVVGAPSSVRALRWSIAAGGHGVKVGAYPTLVVTRDPASWGWSLTNRFVQLSTAHGA